MKKIILASGSPRRKQLLELAGVPFEIIVSNADETVTGAPDAQVKELALRKARAVRDALANALTPEESCEARFFHESFFEGGTGETFFSKKVSPATPPIILGADTLVFINGRVLGKPANEAEAFEMLKMLSGNMHEVHTGFALVRGAEERVFADMTRVFFRELSDAEIREYIATGEPFDKAGAYGVQERGAVLVDRVEGDFYTVVGLPISKVWAALKDMGA
ncbi:MAG: Maf family protein [Defluviitaleaceae bacterium]|nr:Maf family protein [Defluviitaleaceae bacterium]